MSEINSHQDLVLPGREPDVLLPTDVPALDAFVTSITEEFKLPEGDDTYDAIATMILHLPQTKAYMPRSYFGHGVLKSMANKAAYTRLRELAKKRQEKDQAEKDEIENLSLVEPEQTHQDDASASGQSV